VPILGALPRPQKFTVAELELTVAKGETLVVDTRLDRSAFMARHVPGALYAPMNKSFNTVVGSLVEDETTADPADHRGGAVEEAVRDLVRIGYDNIVASSRPETLTRYFDRGGESETIQRIMFADVAEWQDRDDVVVVDVRFAAEYEAGHVPGAINASYTRLPSYVKDRIPHGKTLLVHCVTGGRSARRHRSWPARASTWSTWTVRSRTTRRWPRRWWRPAMAA
jgi:hydroxyacylglutathione hydrolase